MKLVALTVALAMLSNSVVESGKADCIMVVKDNPLIFTNIWAIDLKDEELKSAEGCAANLKTDPTCWSIEFDDADGLCWFVNREGDPASDCTAYTPRSVNYYWIKHPNSKVWGLVEKAGIHTEKECKSFCRLDNDCWNIDFDFVSNICWYSNEHEPTNRNASNIYNHYDLTGNCSDTTVCTLEWTKYPQSKVWGLVAKTGIHTEEECKAFCKLDDDCWNIDFDLVNNNCWYGNEQKPTDRSASDEYNHWDLYTDCSW